MDFRGFVFAFLSDWVAWMSGIASIILTIVEFSIQPQTGRKLFWVAGLICFFVASVHIWTLEHRKYLQSMGELDDLHPKLSAQIDQVATAMFTESKVPFAYLIVSVANLGSDSIANRFYLSAEVEGKLAVNRQLTVLEVPNLKTGNQQLDMNLGNMLPQKCGENPIPHGGMRRGWLLYLFPTLTLEELKTAKMILKFSDVRGVEYSTVPEKGDTIGKTVFYPGVGPLSTDSKKIIYPQ